MGNSASIAADVRLAANFTVRQYEAARANHDVRAISDLVQKRFEERYLTPLLANRRELHGFTLASIACLMMEALRSFQLGHRKTRGTVQRTFEEFIRANSELVALHPVADQFYLHVRNGLLHQAETTGGWRIRKSGALFDPELKCVNAVRLLRQLRHVLARYCRELASASWSDVAVTNCVRKLDSIASECAA